MYKLLYAYRGYIQLYFFRGILGYHTASDFSYKQIKVRAAAGFRKISSEYLLYIRASEQDSDSGQQRLRPKKDARGKCLRYNVQIFFNILKSRG